MELKTDPKTRSFEIRSAARAIREDVVCRTLTESSSTLSYAGLLLDQKRFDLAGQVLEGLGNHADPRIRETAFWLGLRLRIEAGEAGAAKEALLHRLQGDPQNLLALSLLQAAIAAEFDGPIPMSSRSLKRKAAPGRPASAAASPAASAAVEPAAPGARAGHGGNLSFDADLPSDKTEDRSWDRAAEPSLAPPVSFAPLADASLASSLDPSLASPMAGGNASAPFTAPFPPPEASSDRQSAGSPAEPGPESGDQEADDPEAEAREAGEFFARDSVYAPATDGDHVGGLVEWTLPAGTEKAGPTGAGDGADAGAEAAGAQPARGKHQGKWYVKKEEFRPLLSDLPSLPLGPLEAAAANLDAGGVQKIILVFEEAQIHLLKNDGPEGAELAALVTRAGPESILSGVRFENAFWQGQRKKAAGAGAGAAQGRGARMALK